MMTPGISPPRIATAMARAPEASCALWCSVAGEDTCIYNLAQTRAGQAAIARSRSFFTLHGRARRGYKTPVNFVMGRMVLRVSPLDDGQQAEPAAACRGNPALGRGRGTAHGAAGEELLWRGTYLEAFPMMYAGCHRAMGGLHAVASRTAKLFFPSRHGRISFLGGAALMGAASAHVTWKTRGPRWTLPATFRCTRVRRPVVSPSDFLVLYALCLDVPGPHEWPVQVVGQVDRVRRLGCGERELDNRGGEDNPVAPGSACRCHQESPRAGS